MGSLNLLSPAAAAENERNLWEFSLRLGRARGGQIYDTPELKWTYAGGPAFNRVFAARLPRGAEVDYVADVTSRFITWKAPVVWITGPSTQPDDLDRLLGSCGWGHASDWACMAADLHAMPERPPAPHSLTIEEVLDERSLRAFGRVTCHGFGFHPSIHAAACRHLLNLGVGPEAGWRHFLGKMHGRAVASCSLFCSEAAAGLYLISTVPAARRQGIATAVTWHVMNEARAQGHRLAVLQASEMGACVYPRLGFVEHCRMGLYLLRP